ncbi:MAG: lactate racemase domain-containing protein [Thermoanaerobacteraceae bacterium]|nr:lactate racemase domain-containing protein [Thermoanaerobacteraceae bacterium]
MGVIEELLKDVEIPNMVKIKQHFKSDRIAPEDIPDVIYHELHKGDILERIRPGQKVGITVGSRGIANVAFVVRELVKNIKKAGAEPYIIPCMGSHGGATAQGQKEVLESLGVTEEYAGAPIFSSMEVVKIGKTVDGLDVYLDKYASTMDAIILLNRIKPHTAFRGEVESGLQKMIAIGLGKQKGAETCHAAGFGEMYKNITQIADVVLQKVNIPFAIGLIENAYDETAKIIALKKEEIKTEEPELLRIAKENMPRILFDEIDVLVIDEIGKNISGDGMDPNITGRYPTPYSSGGPKVSKMVVLDLTKESHGNGNGVGTSDFTTRRFMDKMKLEETYPNALTSTVTGPVKIPMILENDELAIKAAIKTCNRNPAEGIRMVRIKNTLKLEEIWISEALLPLAKENKDIDIIDIPHEMVFDDECNLF